MASVGSDKRSVRVWLVKHLVGKGFLYRELQLLVSNEKAAQLLASSSS